MEGRKRRQILNNLSEYRRGMDMIQCLDRYNKLKPVPKIIRMGRNGGLYYENAKGNKVYLSRRQQEQFIQGTLRFCVKNCTI